MRIDSLTFFRFIAAFVVVIFHFGRETWFRDFFGNFVISGPEMVTFFFVLSGFVMVISQFNKPNFSKYKYYYNRVARIMPIYLLGLILIIPFIHNSISNTNSFLLNVMCLQSWISPFPLSFNSPAWSISVEMFFYATFPLLLFLIKKAKPNPGKLLLFSISIWIFTQLILINLLNSTFYQGFQTTSHDLIFYFPLSHYCSFLIGISVAYFFITSNYWKRVFNPKLSIIFIVLSLFLIHYLITHKAMINNFFGLKMPYGSSFFAPIFGLSILLVATSNNVLTRFLSIKPFIFLGEISFSIYILHTPLHKIYLEYLAPIVEGYELTKTQDFIFFTILLLFTCTITYYLIEKPCQSFLIKRFDVLKFKFKKMKSTTNSFVQD
jgi:peptidoglycan/LPS O-acetylase OafA/YrhL